VVPISVTLGTDPVISQRRGKDVIVIMTKGTYSLTFVTHIFRNGYSSLDGDCKAFEMMTST